MATQIVFGTSPEQLIRILSASIAPVIVISGVGLLLLSMTNRYSRVIDLARDLLKDLESIMDHSSRREKLVEQVRIIYRRARILRRAIIMASLCILFVTFRVAIFLHPGRRHLAARFGVGDWVLH